MAACFLVRSEHIFSDVWSLLLPLPGGECGVKSDGGKAMILLKFVDGLQLLHHQTEKPTAVLNEFTR